MRPIYMGATGWAYDDWKGVFYAQDIKASEMLAQYSRVFEHGTVVV